MIYLDVQINPFGNCSIRKYSRTVEGGTVGIKLCSSAQPVCAAGQTYWLHCSPWLSVVCSHSGQVLEIIKFCGFEVKIYFKICVSASVPHMGKLIEVRN
jgi:hypothetical protein